MSWNREEMADKVITFFKPGCSVNLGIGLPTMIAERLPTDLEIMVHSENGILGVEGRPTKSAVSPTLINAGKETVAVGKKASFFDSALSFGIIRGGHLDFSVLGGMQVDARGSLANWMIPGKKVTGMGGAMDLVNGSKNVIVMLNHFSKNGECKLVAECDLPLTGHAVVDLVVSTHGVFKPCGNHFETIEVAPGVNMDDLKMGDLLL